MKDILGDRPLSQSFEKGVESQVENVQDDDLHMVYHIADDSILDELQLELESAEGGGENLFSNQEQNFEQSDESVSANTDGNRNPISDDTATSSTENNGVSGNSKRVAVPGSSKIFVSPPVKKPRAEKLLESVLGKHEEFSIQQQNDFLNTMKQQRESELESQRAWESAERDKQRQWEQRMIEWQTAQTNQMMAVINSSMVETMKKIVGKNSGEDSGEAETDSD